MSSDWNIEVQANPGGKYHDSAHGIHVNYQNYGFKITVNDETISILDSASEVDNVVEALKKFIRQFDTSCDCNAEYLITEYTLRCENSDPEIYQYVADDDAMKCAVDEALENGFRIINRNDLNDECNLGAYFEESGEYPIGCLVVVKIN